MKGGAGKMTRRQSALEIRRLNLRDWKEKLNVVLSDDDSKKHIESKIKLCTTEIDILEGKVG